MREYDNLEDLRRSEPDVAEELVDSVRDGEWKNNPLLVFNSYKDIGVYEIYDGMLSEFMKSAVDVFDFRRYIDAEWLAQDLVADGDTYIQLSDVIVESTTGWW